MPKNHRLDKWEAQHRRNLTKYEAQIVELFRGAVREAASLTHLLGDFNPEKPFSFSDYPITQQRVERLLGGLKNNIYGVIVNGVRSEWTLANNKNNELCNQVFGDAIGALSQEQYERYYSTNPKAEEAFLARAEQGLNLSDRVWKYTDQFKEEIEMGLDLGLRQGLSADEMSKQLRSFLMHPNTLFRRVRDEHGQLQLSKAAKAYHPGRGVYRSSYKNARRLAATECNIAYRTADYERWQDLDFVVGMRIVLSNNHTLNGEPFEDICDQLSAPLGSKATSGRGCYPKDFKFTGWHPLCRCHTESILKTREEMAADNARILAGEPVSTRSANTVDDVPQEFKDWLKDNEKRAQRSYSMPYFIKDNPQYLPKGYQNLYGLKAPYASYAEYEKAMKYNKQHAGFSKAQLANNRELNEALPVLQGQIMPFGMADRGHPNPNFSIENASELGYHHNCQTCTVAYELRRRGFDVTAKSNRVAHTQKLLVNGVEVEVEHREIAFWQARTKLSWQQRFLNPDGTDVVPIKSAGIENTIEAKKSFIEAHTQEVGRYEVYCRWDAQNAHVFIIEKQKGGNLVWYDPQSAEIATMEERYLKKMIHSDIWVTRIDDKLVNPKFAERLLQAEH